MFLAISVAHGRTIPNTHNPQGKPDPGYVNMNWGGMRENTVSDQISMILCQMLDCVPGLHFFPLNMCFDGQREDKPKPRHRTGGMDLKEKCEFINAGVQGTPYDLAIEIHLNAFDDPDVNGAEVLYGMAKEQAMVFQKHFVNCLLQRDRGIKHEPSMYFIRHTNCPALILEPAFLSNPETANDVRSGLFQGEAAFACYRALCELGGLGSYDYSGGIEIDDPHGVTLTLE